MKIFSTMLAVILIPLSLWAMTPVTDSDLSDVTGQAGVNINADLTMNVLIGTMAWGDSDGIEFRNSFSGPDFTLGVYSGGFVGVDNFNLTNLKVKARGSSLDNWNGYSTYLLKPITIDVATGDKSAVDGAVQQTFVRFGLGSLFISMDAMSMNVGTSAGYTTGAVTISDIMGSINMGAMQMYINPTSYVDIFSHSGTGVSFQMRVTIDRFSMGYMSWGDADGVASYGTDDVVWLGPPTGQGYIGLRNMNFGSSSAPAFVISGTAAIDVVTSRSGQYAITPIVFKAAFAHYMRTMFGSAFDPFNLPAGTENGFYQAFQNWLAYSGGSTYIPTYYSLLAADPNNTITEIISGTTYQQAPSGVMPVTVVHISFPENFSFSMDSMRSQVVLANNANLNTTGGVAPKDQVLGDIYLNQVSLQIRNGSWVDIWAH